MVECDLAKVEVAGSNPVSRSIFFSGRHSQVVRQRSAKPPLSSSNLDAASILSFSEQTPFTKSNGINLLAIIPVHPESNA